MTNKPLVIGGVSFAAGLAAGFASGYFVTKQKLEQHYNNLLAVEVDATKEFYERRHKKQEYDSPEAAVKHLIPPEIVATLQTYDSQSDYKSLGFKKETAEQEVEEDKQEEKEEKEDVETTVPDVTPISNGNEVSAEIQTEIDARSSDNPYIISEEEFLAGEEDYVNVSLTYFEGDDVLVDERNQPVIEVNNTVGDENLKRFGHRSNDENILYIRNEVIQLDIEVSKSDGEYRKEVLGFGDDEKDTRTRANLARDESGRFMARVPQGDDE